jgi:ferredoxin
VSAVRKQAAGLTIAVDHRTCSGTGYCQEHFPQVFEVHDSRSWLRDEADLAALSRDDLDEIEGVCPWFAITVSTGDTHPGH